MLRLDHPTLVSITGRRRKSLQARWFKDYLGADVPCDERGPIITQQAYNALLEKRLGLRQGDQISQPEKAGRPVVHLPRSKAAA